jgi:hypothetical protein
LPKYSYHRYLAIFHKSSSSRIRAAAEKAAVDSAAVDSAVAEKAAADLEVADLEAMAAVQAAEEAAADSYQRRHNSPAAAAKADTLKFQQNFATLMVFERSLNTGTTKTDSPSTAR